MLKTILVEDQCSEDRPTKDVLSNDGWMTGWNTMDRQSRKSLHGQLIESYLNQKAFKTRRLEVVKGGILLAVEFFIGQIKSKNDEPVFHNEAEMLLLAKQNFVEF